MENDLAALQKAISNDIFQLILPIQTTKTIDKEAYRSLYDNIKAVARILKGVERIPKKLLNDIRNTIKVLIAEAPYLKGETDLLMDWAKELEFSFDLILLGESHEDRVPGVPRII